MSDSRTKQLQNLRDAIKRHKAFIETCDRQLNDAANLPRAGQSIKRISEQKQDCLESLSDLERTASLLKGDLIPESIAQPAPSAAKTQSANTETKTRKPTAKTKLPQMKQDLSGYLDSVKLTPRQRECFSLRMEYDLSLQQIGKRLGIAAKTVSEHIDAATRRFQMDKSFQNRQRRSSEDDFDQ
jgi:RNA polymerase sigma factor (sigma-70 family)